MSELELTFFNQLNEKQKRLYVELKSTELGYHGVSEISKVFGVHSHTIRLSQKKLKAPDLLASNKIRKSGGGRKKKQKVFLKL